MPAALIFSISPGKIPAVTAKIGIRSASDRFRLRMRLVAVSPSISGIITSIRMISKLFSGAFLKSSNAAFPFSALVTTAPASVSIYSAISRFSVLSSAKRIFTPERLANFFCCAATFGFSNGSSSVKVEPLCSWLSAVMVPPMRSTKPFTIAIPKPLP